MIPQVMADVCVIVNSFKKLVTRKMDGPILQTRNTMMETCEKEDHERNRSMPEYVLRAQRKYKNKKYAEDPLFREKVREQYTIRMERLKQDPEAYTRHKEIMKERCKASKLRKRLRDLKAVIESDGFIEEVSRTCHVEVDQLDSSRVVRMAHDVIEALSLDVFTMHPGMKLKKYGSTVVYAVLKHCCKEDKVSGETVEDINAYVREQLIMMRKV
jgi:hypothetical protein